jgi:hypothetical protein
VDDQEFAALVEAARGDIPERYVRVVSYAVSPDGAAAVVGLLTNEPPAVEPEVVICDRTAGSWRGGHSSGGTGAGWSTTSSEGKPNLGVAYAWHEAPEGVIRAVLEFGGRQTEVPVENGFFVHAEWNVPDSAPLPEVRRLVHDDGRVEEVESGWPFSGELWQKIVALRASRAREARDEPDGGS